MGIYARFADLLEYPGAGFEDRIARCIAALPEGAPGARPALEGFRDAVGRMRGSGLEEAYTASFDFDPAAALYVGHHLFGQDGRRAVFLCHLAGEYEDSGFRWDAREAPDHLAVMLRYLDAPGVTAPARDDLVGEAVVPAAVAIHAALAGAQHPYAAVLEALLAVIRPARPAEGRNGLTEDRNSPTEAVKGRTEARHDENRGVARETV